VLKKIRKTNELEGQNKCKKEITTQPLQNKNICALLKYKNTPISKKKKKSKYTAFSPHMFLSLF